VELSTTTTTLQLKNVAPSNSQMAVAVIITTSNQSHGIHGDAINLARALERIGIKCFIHFDQYAHTRELDLSSLSLTHLSSIRPYSISDASEPTHSPLLSIASLPKIDFCIQIESLNISLAKSCLVSGIKYYLLVNLEWATASKGSSPRPNHAVAKFVHEVKCLNVICLARTIEIYQRLLLLGIRAELTFWSLPGPITACHIQQSPRPSRKTRSFLYSGGNLGWLSRRGADIAIQAILGTAIPTSSDVKLTYKTNKDALPPGAEQRLRSMNVNFLAGFVDKSDLINLYEEHSFFLYPSRFEGYGLSLLEALHHGCIPIVTNGWPMREICGSAGIYIRSKQFGYIRMANIYEPDPEDLICKIKDICSLSNKELDRLLASLRRKAYYQSIALRINFFKRLKLIFLAR
jgi:hypothetical protein